MLRLLIFFSLIFFSFSSHLISAPTKESMKQDMDTYFAAEKKEGMIFMGVGAGSILSGAYFSGQNDRYHQGMALPFLGFGLIQSVTGAAVYFRTDQQLETYKAKLDANPQKFKEAEKERMYKVKENFGMYKSLEFAALMIGLYAYHTGSTQKNDSIGQLTGASNPGDYQKGLGTGLIIQSSLMLLMDFFAERRAGVYWEALYNLQAFYTPASKDREGLYGFGTTIRF